jgi:hypothetical protein
MKIELSQKELDLINEALKQENSPLKIDASRAKENQLYVIDLSEDKVIEIREVCGDYLQIVGFDENYNPSEKGTILEGLIDKLFVP